MKCPECGKSLVTEFTERFMTNKCECGFKENSTKIQYKFNQNNTGRSWTIWIRERQEPHRMLKDKSTVGKWKDWKELKYPGTINGLAESLVLLLTQFESGIVETQTDLLTEVEDIQTTLIDCTNRIVDAIENNKGVING